MNWKVHIFLSAIHQSEQKSALEVWWQTIHYAHQMNWIDVLCYTVHLKWRNFAVLCKITPSLSAKKYICQPSNDWFCSRTASQLKSSAMNKCVVGPCFAHVVVVHFVVVVEFFWDYCENDLIASNIYPVKKNGQTKMRSVCFESYSLMSDQTVDAVFVLYYGNTIPTCALWLVL